MRENSNKHVQPSSYDSEYTSKEEMKRERKELKQKKVRKMKKRSLEEQLT